MIWTGITGGDEGPRFHNLILSSQSLRFQYQISQPVLFWTAVIFTTYSTCGWTPGVRSVRTAMSWSSGIADDNVLGFQYRADADRFLTEFRERLGKFGLELHPDKTRRIEFGRFAEHDRKKRGEGKPETFDFLGFTHISGKDRNGNFAVKRHTIGKRMRGKLVRH